jgi:cytochrome c oxidase subunit 1
LPFLYNVWRSYKYGQIVTVDDPWGHGNSLEWATSCPPPLRNFDWMPRIRSERPAFDLHFPELAAGGQSIAGPPEGGATLLTSEADGGATYREDTSTNLDYR